MPVDRLAPPALPSAVTAGPDDPIATIRPGAYAAVAASGMVLLELVVRALPADGVSGVNVCCTVA